MEQTKGAPRHMQVLKASHTKTLVELERYKLLVESVEDYAIFLLDPEGYVVSWNKGAERHKGYKAHEIIGKHFSIFYTQEDNDARKPERELEIAKKLGRIEDEDWRVRRDGSRFWANVIITALYDTDGKLVGFGKVTRNLTDRKQQEDDLRRINAQLRKQQEELRRLNESKDEFISLASHQLRTPATIVKQLLGILLAGFSGSLEKEQVDLIEKANETNDRQISIVNSLLEVAQVDAGKVVLHRTPADVVKLLKDVVDDQRENIAKKEQSVTFNVIQSIPDISFDAKYLRMAFENLIDNATKYTHDGGAITVSVARHGEEVRIAITDNGVGIPPRQIEELFTKFKRIPNELSQMVSGSGLGLYWVRKIVDLHGGYIEAASELGKGTTFTIMLPAGDDNA